MLGLVDDAHAAAADLADDAEVAERHAGNDALFRLRQDIVQHPQPVEAFGEFDRDRLVTMQEIVAIHGLPGVHGRLILAHCGHEHRVGRPIGHIDGIIAGIAHCVLPMDRRNRANPRTQSFSTLSTLRPRRSATAGKFEPFDIPQDEDGPVIRRQRIEHAATRTASSRRTACRLGVLCGAMGTAPSIAMTDRGPRRDRVPAGGRGLACHNSAGLNWPNSGRGPAATTPRTWRQSSRETPANRGALPETSLGRHRRRRSCRETAGPVAPGRAIPGMAGAPPAVPRAQRHRPPGPAQEGAAIDGRSRFHSLRIARDLLQSTAAA